jgi:molybdopterin/thiamine biosynthesis adenylyltransferase
MLISPSVQKQLEELNLFLVGAGALGCEFMKNFALMGACCSGKGKLTVTDDDVIEKSNLSRQFLFRDKDIGRYCVIFWACFRCQSVVNFVMIAAHSP